MTTQPTWKQFEREVARAFRKLKYKVNRLFGTQFAEGGEIDLEALGYNHFFDIQCKYTSDKGKLSNRLRTSWEEASSAARDGRKPLGVVRLRSVGTWVVIGYHDFLDILSEESKLTDGEKED